MATLGTNGTWLHVLTRDLSDADFEAAVTVVRKARQAARETVAYERQMDIATHGLHSQRLMYEHRSGEDKLLSTYIRAGFSKAEALRMVRELR